MPYNVATLVYTIYHGLNSSLKDKEMWNLPNEYTIYSFEYHEAIEAIK